MYFSSTPLPSLPSFLLLLSEKDMVGLLEGGMFGDVESREKMVNPGSPGRMAIEPACVCVLFTYCYVAM